MRLNRSNQTKVLIDLDGEGKKLDQTRRIRLQERERLTTSYNIKEGELQRVSSNLLTLEERRGLLDSEMKKM